MQAAFYFLIVGAAVYEFYVHTLAICSYLHTFLPPWEFLSDFPRAQKWYKVFVYVIGYIAMNARSTVYRSISVNGKSNGAPK